MVPNQTAANDGSKCKKEHDMDFYSLDINTPAGQHIAMKDFEGKVVLIVNTATQCGLTPQFDGLEKLHQTYKDQGLVVIGTPCNQFAKQEPLTNEQMTETCRINHGVTFQLTEKIKVNGANTHPLYKYLKSKLGSWLGSNIKWNFTKFLIDRDGQPYKRYAPTTTPEKIEADIKKLLG
jgi:glutathione peroxidase